MALELLSRLRPGTIGPVRRLMIGLVRLYQAILRPVLPPACRFHPTCSEYMAEAVAKRGAFRGVAMGLFRILRCNPWSPGGYDPVDRP